MTIYVTAASVLEKVDKEKHVLNTLWQRKYRWLGMCLEMRFYYKTLLKGE